MGVKETKKRLPNPTDSAVQIQPSALMFIRAWLSRSQARKRKETNLQVKNYR